jgi:hypothetical protein
MSAGCSGTPLPRKLGHRDGQTALFVGLPESLTAPLLATAFGPCWRLEPAGPLPEPCRRSIWRMSSPPSGR